MIHVHSWSLNTSKYPNWIKKNLEIKIKEKKQKLFFLVFLTKKDILCSIIGFSPYALSTWKINFFDNPIWFSNIMKIENCIYNFF
jgi:hypothetical protein